MSKTRRVFSNGLLRRYSNCWEITCYLDECFQTHLCQTNCFLHNPAKPFKSLRSAPLGGNASVVNYVFSFRNTTLCVPIPKRNRLKVVPKPLSERVWVLFEDRKLLENQVFTTVLTVSALKLFKARALGEALTRKSLAVSPPLIYLLKAPIQQIGHFTVSLQQWSPFAQKNVWLCL